MKKYFLPHVIETPFPIFRCRRPKPHLSVPTCLSKYKFLYLKCSLVLTKFIINK